MCRHSTGATDVSRLSPSTPTPHPILITPAHNRNVRILVVEDDMVIASQLAKALERERYQVDVVRDGVSGEHQARAENYSLIVLDIMLPERDGWTVCENLRRSKIRTPILMLTARDDVDDRVRGLDAGADDYLPKPFDLRELMARIRALQRRDKVNRSGTIAIDDLEIDTVGHVVKRAGQVLQLTRREYTLLEALARNEGRTLTREAILERVWENEESQPNTVNFHVVSLRRKVDQDHARKLIHTVHGIGYVLKVPD